MNWLDDLEAKEKAASKAPWKPRVSLITIGDKVRTKADADLIAALRNAAPKLIAEVRAAREWLRQEDLDMGDAIRFESETAHPLDAARGAFRHLVEQHDGEQNGGEGTNAR